MNRHYDAQEGRSAPGARSGMVSRTGGDRGPHGLTPVWAVFGLAMGPAVALGLARFGYALLLPSMRAELGWSFADAGAMNTSNAAGYLIGALLAAPLGRRFGDKVAFCAGLFLTAIAIGAAGFTSSYSPLLALRFSAGLSGAIAFVAGAGITSAAAVGGERSRAPTMLGIYFAGAGIGITVSALVVPPMVQSISWRVGWLVLGTLGLAATAFGASVLGRTPEPSYKIEHAHGGWSAKFLACKLVAYGLFGAGYIAYATFIISYLRTAEKFDGAAISAFWAILGLSAVVAAFAWGPILARLKGGWGTSATIAIVAVGAGLPLVWPGATGAYLSSILFGGSVLAVIAAVTSFARRAARPHAWTAAIAALTIAFGIGQCVGPVLTGMISDGPNGVRSGLWLSVLILAAAAVIAAFQKEPELDE